MTSPWNPSSPSLHSSASSNSSTLTLRPLDPDTETGNENVAFPSTSNHKTKDVDWELLREDSHKFLDAFYDDTKALSQACRDDAENSEQLCEARDESLDRLRQSIKDIRWLSNVETYNRANRLFKTERAEVLTPKELREALAEGRGVAESKVSRQVRSARFSSGVSKGAVEYTYDWAPKFGKGSLERVKSFRFVSDDYQCD